MGGRPKDVDKTRETDEGATLDQPAAQSPDRTTSPRSANPNPDYGGGLHQPRIDRNKLDTDGNNKPASSHADGETTDSSHNDCYNYERRPDPPVVVSPGIVEFSLESIREQLTCRLCEGCFREPYTLTKCLHTFCKSCFYLAFARTNYECPTCHQYLGQNLQKCALADRVLQNLIDKVIFPEMAQLDRLNEEAFYEKLGLGRKPAGFDSYSKVPLQQQSHAASVQVKRKEKTSDASEGASLGASVKKSKRNQPSTATLTDDRKQPPPSNPRSLNEVVFRLLPNDDAAGRGGGDATVAVPALQNPYIKTSGSLRIGQLKKYLCQQLNLHPTATSAASTATDAAPAAAGRALSSSSMAMAATMTPADQTEILEVLCHGVPLGNELSVQFVQRAVWFAPSTNTTCGGERGEVGAPRSGGGTEADSDDVLTLTYRMLRVHPR